MSIDARLYLDRGDFVLDVDLSLPGRGITAIFGASGCGKTTLLRTIAGLETKASGYLKIGTELWQDQDFCLPTHQRQLGYVFQEPSLFPHLNVQQNIAYGGKRLKGNQEKSSLAQVVALLGLEHLLARKPQQLSGGEQQRVAIARALAVNPALLLLDEPLAALDFQRKQEIMPYLESLHQSLNIPVLYVSHARDEVARLADYLVLLETGRVTAVGEAVAVFSRLDLPLAHAPDAETLIEAQVSAYDERFALNALDFSGGRFWVAGDQRAVGSNVRLQIFARDVSLTLSHQSQTSILNIFSAKIDAISTESKAQVTVRLQIGAVFILARITRKSMFELDLIVGKTVYAQIKSVALLH